MNADEAGRRQSNAETLMTYFQAHPLVWLGWRSIAAICASPASWRTRISDCRKIAQRDGADIVWNRNCRESAYMFKPFTPLGRSAEQHLTQKPLFDWARHDQ